MLQVFDLAVQTLQVTPTITTTYMRESLPHFLEMLLLVLLLGLGVGELLGGGQAARVKAVAAGRLRLGGGRGVAAVY